MRVVKHMLRAWTWSPELFAHMGRCFRSHGCLLLTLGKKYKRMSAIALIISTLGLLHQAPDYNLCNISPAHPDKKELSLKPSI